VAGVILAKQGCPIYWKNCFNQKSLRSL